MSNFQQRNLCYTALWYDLDIIITDYTQLFAAMKALHPTDPARAAGAVSDGVLGIRETAGLEAARC